jgi:hypothetical protein
MGEMEIKKRGFLSRMTEKKREKKSVSREWKQSTGGAGSRM